MNKYFLIFALILVFIFAFSAGIVFAQYAYFGIKGGLNLSSFHGDDADPVNWGGGNKKARTAFLVGPYATVVLAKFFALQPEVLFSMKGSVYEYTEVGFSSTTTVKVDYVEIPLLFKFYVPVETGPLKLNVFAGPQVSFNITHKYKYSEEELGLPGYEEEGDIEDIFWYVDGTPAGTMKIKTIDYGAVFGAGVDFIIKSIQMSVEGRYDLGLSKNTEISGFGDLDLKNGTLSILVGVGF